MKHAFRISQKNSSCFASTTVRKIASDVSVLKHLLKRVTMKDAPGPGCYNVPQKWGRKDPMKSVRKTVDSFGDYVFFACLTN